MKILSIKRQSAYTSSYDGFYTEENIMNEWLGDYYETKIWKCLFGVKYKLIHHYRMKAGNVPILAYPLPVHPTYEETRKFIEGEIVGYKLKFYKANNINH